MHKVFPGYQVLKQPKVKVSEFKHVLQLHKKVCLFYKKDLKNSVLFVKDDEQSLRIGITQATLLRRVNKNSLKFGSVQSTGISAKTEGLLVEAMKYIEDLGWPLDQG